MKKTNKNNGLVHWRWTLEHLLHTLVYSGLLAIKPPSISHSRSTPKRQTISTFSIEVGFPVFHGCPSSSRTSPVDADRGLLTVTNTHQRAHPSFKRTQGSTTMTVREGLWGTRGLWLKPQDGSAGCLTLKGCWIPKHGYLTSKEQEREKENWCPILNPDPESSEFSKPDQWNTKPWGWGVGYIWWSDIHKHKWKWIKTDCFWSTGAQRHALCWALWSPGACNWIPPQALAPGWVPE